MTTSDPRGAIGFAEKIVALLDEGRYTATYKYAVLLALIDLCLEHTQAMSSGGLGGLLATRRSAGRSRRWLIRPPGSIRGGVA